MKTEVTCKVKDPTYKQKVSVSIDRSGMTAYDFIENVIIPLMLGMGYSEKTVREAVA